jgi:general secretion pathway protein D
MEPPGSAVARWLSAFAAFLLVLLTAAAALAQTAPQQPPSVLTGVSVVDTSPSENSLLLTFTPVAPKYSVVQNGTDRPAIGFGLTTRGQGASTPARLKGLLRGVEFEQIDTNLLIHMATTAGVQVSISPEGGQALRVTLTNPRPGRARAEAVAVQASGPLPRGSDRPEEEDGFELVLLKYADVSEVVGLLTEGLTVKANDSFIPHEPAFGSAGMGGSAAFSAPPPPNPDQLDQPLGQSVDEYIGIDRRLNAIILKGSLARIARLKQKIAEIDRPVQSVVLETIFVELSETGAKNVGIDFNNANSQIAVGTMTAGAFIPPGFRVDRTLSSAALQAAIYAQVSAGEGRIVSKPRIAAQSGASAKIVTGDALPILTSIQLSGVNGVSQQVQYVNVGVTLQIAPRVSADGYVTSHVFCVASTVTGFSQGYPTISQREAETSATVRDGETFVIGGLTEDTDISTKEKLPGLGDIPLLGALFSLQKATGSKRELYIVVTPHVVKAGEPLPAEVTAARMVGAKSGRP